MHQDATRSSRERIRASRLLAFLLGGALLGYLSGLLAGEAVAYDSARGPWWWFWSSYGDPIRLGALSGAALGMVTLWLLPRALRGGGASAARLAVLLACLTAAGCVHSSRAPEGLGPESCEADPRLLGVWKSSRSSQLGPAAMRFEFGCDCAYASQAKAALTRVRERGRYWTEGDRLSFSRATGEVTTWRYEMDDGDLLLEEAAGETHRYRRVRDVSCP